MWTLMTVKFIRSHGRVPLMPQANRSRSGSRCYERGDHPSRKCRLANIRDRIGECAAAQQKNIMRALFNSIYRPGSSPCRCPALKNRVYTGLRAAIGFAQRYQHELDDGQGGFWMARRTLPGYKAMAMIRNGQVCNIGEATTGLKLPASPSGFTSLRDDLT
jgi:hypothetical protein